VRVVNRYDIGGLTYKQYLDAKGIVFFEPNVDNAYDEIYPELENSNLNNTRVFAIEYVPGQYDQRADSAEQCVQILTLGERPIVRTAKVIILEGNIKDIDFDKIKHYLINPIESKESSMEKPLRLDSQIYYPEDITCIKGFIDMSEVEIIDFHKLNSFAMSSEDMLFCQKYFRDKEQRDPSITELKVLDTYWSDHCRHTTFLTKIDNVDFEEGKQTQPIIDTFDMYLKSRESLYANSSKEICLMDIATIGMKELKKKGKIPDLDESEEINACSIKVNVDVDGENEEWLIMFKNETHNHPTEIEPFGGAATCLGGAIRDPLSGRSYVYQAMRVTGSGDPRTKIADTYPGKLPQVKITTGAANGYSSYGNQIGLATGNVTEVYHEGYVAKRMEIGAVVGAVPYKNVRREKPKEGDVIILLGGRTGRDGCGGATGSSKEHTEESLINCGSEVQKGNPLTERKIQRLFRNPKVSLLIKKCNDFGAGGVSVAIGELADGVLINLDKITKKYEGLDGTELAISESQERMAVVVDSQDASFFIEEATKENLEATIVAYVTNDYRLQMKWREKTIVNISREFLNTNGVAQKADVKVSEPQIDKFYDKFIKMKNLKISRELWKEVLEDLNVCSQKGLVDRFDSSIGACTVNMPFGGKYQLSPEDSMISKIPLISGKTNTGTVMSFGFNPEISTFSPFHGGVYAVLEAVSKVVASGCDYTKIRLSLQEYFEKLGKDPNKWGKPFTALLGAYLAQKMFEIPAIGGKDSMSGTFMDMNVPPTLVAFAIAPVDVTKSLSGTFASEKSKVYVLVAKYDKNLLPDFEYMKNMYTKLTQSIGVGNILSARAVKSGGIVEAVSKMSFGNMIGLSFDGEYEWDWHSLRNPSYGSVVIEMSEDVEVEKIFEGVEIKYLGKTSRGSIALDELNIDLKELCEFWLKPLSKVFPIKAREPEILDTNYSWDKQPSTKSVLKSGKTSIVKPRVFMPVFPGTNCEYDTKRVFEDAGGIVEIFIINNMSIIAIEESIKEMANKIKNAQIIALPGGFSGGDEPDGSGKFIATAFRNKYVKESVMELLNVRDGLIIGICNGFQALIKLGLLPYGQICELDENSPTLTYNNIGRHISKMVNTKVVSNLSPWLNNTKVGDIHCIPVSHGEGKFVANTENLKNMMDKGQIATQYVDLDGNISSDISFNPNGSTFAIEGITSPCGRVFGKMGHSERVGEYVCKNVPGNKQQGIFDAGIKYFR
jgi:phosphoribosylformylglycinamidine synthase